MNKRLVLSNAPEPFTTPEKPRVFRKKSSYNVDLLVAIKDNMEELKSTLHACGVKWSALYDKGVKTKHTILESIKPFTKQVLKLLKNVMQKGFKIW